MFRMFFMYVILRYKSTSETTNQTTLIIGENLNDKNVDHVEQLF